MTSAVRMMLLIGALCVFVFVIFNIRKSKLVIADSIFWFLFAAMLVFMGAFPNVAYDLTRALGFISPSNVVFLIVIALLIVRMFQMEIKVANLTEKLKHYVQEDAIKEKDKQ